MDEFTEDIDYLARQLMEKGVMPSEFYNSSLSDVMTALNAKPREERIQDPLAFANSIGGYRG